MGIVEQYLLQLKTEKRRLRRTAVVLTALSLLVATGVSWNLRMTGVALANDACCGYEEHQHTDECLVQNIVCGYDVEPAAEIDEDMAFAPYEFDPILDSNSEGEPLHIHVDALMTILTISVILVHSASVWPNLSLLQGISIALWRVILSLLLP